MKLALYDWNSCLQEIVEILKPKHILLKDYQDAEKMVVWNECEHNGWKKRIDYMQERGREVILYQQGIYGADWVRPPFNRPIISDKVLVWGEGDKKRLLKYNVPEEKIIITGSPLVHRLKPRVAHKGKNVVFALEHWDWGDVIENNIVAVELRKLKGPTVYTKGLETENNTFAFQNPVVSKRDTMEHLDIVAELLAKTDLLVAISESTISLFAEILDIPVVIPDVWIPKPRGGIELYTQFEKNCSNAVTICKLEELNDTILHQLEHPEILREERRKAAIENGGLGIKDPVQNIINVIEK